MLKWILFILLLIISILFVEPTVEHNIVHLAPDSSSVFIIISKFIVTGLCLLIAQLIANKFVKK